MKKHQVHGFFNGIIAAVCYGVNPLFTLPMYKMGMNVNSVLFYRYIFAVIIYGAVLKFFKKTDFRISLKEFVYLFFMAIVFASSSIALFESLRYIDSGIVCTILFVYPVMVALISTIFFKEKLTKTSIFAMLMVVGGIFTLNGGISGDDLNLKGVFLILLSAFFDALYVVLVKNLRPLRHMRHDKLSFYVMLFAFSIFILNLKFCTELQPIDNWLVFFCAIALAIFPTVIALETISLAIRLIGPTTTAILGALEPITAIILGVLVFKEVLTANSIVGIILIFTGVMMIILRNRFKKKS